MSQDTAIEKHYGRAMDIEWAKDGLDGQLYIVQARPETVRSNEQANVIEMQQPQEEEDPEEEDESVEPEDVEELE